MGVRARVFLASVVLLATLGTTISGLAVNAADVSTINRHPWWWVVGSILGVTLVGLLGLSAQRHYTESLRELIPPAESLAPGVVLRPERVDAVVRALIAGADRSVGITTSLQGAGGFGKTTLAQMVRADARILRRFKRRVHWVTLGRDARGGTLLERLNGLLSNIDRDQARTFTDIEAASQYLASLLSSGSPRPLILDDVWTQEQLAAFPVAGKARRLVTTRSASLVAEAAPVQVDAMTTSEARDLLVRQRQVAEAG